MHFPKYWTTAQDKTLTAWGWSDESPAHAGNHAAERLMKIKAWLARGGKSSSQQRYGYGDRPMREEVLREFRKADGTLRAAVTRNSYGCLVLNTADLMFVDVDAPEAKESSFLAGLFGFRKPDKGRTPDAFLNGVAAKVEDWLKRQPDWGWRVYRTAAGVRLMATHQAIPPEHGLCKLAFESFESDPLYRKLCATQKCFRARLTPKPWRVDMDKPRGRWPWANEKTEARFRKWESEYAATSQRFATCNLIGHFGRTEIAPDLQPLVELHDQATRAESKLPLA
ncbi:MAG TPA: hypothetical protein PKA41_09085 [Verrucomicrobiota bacterium]|nr:hypothetical protein [Verrucomicrobiota bacterium]